MRFATFHFTNISLRKNSEETNEGKHSSPKAIAKKGVNHGTINLVICPVGNNIFFPEETSSEAFTFKETKWER